MTSDVTNKLNENLLRYSLSLPAVGTLVKLIDQVDELLVLFIILPPISDKSRLS